MERLVRTGKIRMKSAAEAENSRLGIGFEKLDRGLFDPEKAYDKIAGLGVKWARIQSGWMRTEKIKGVYDFAWLDSIVDNLLKRNLKPWICLCYGNEVYSPFAKKYFGNVGCPPIETEEETEGWLSYVKACVSHYRGKIEYFEIWNEPDLKYSWRHNTPEGEDDHGPDAYQYAGFAIRTAKAIREADPDVKIVGCAIAHLYDLTFVNTCMSMGPGDYIDAVSFHAYMADETKRAERIEALRTLLDSYRPGLEIIQGETGSQSRSDGAGALRGFAWTPQKQTKHLLRNLVIDLAHDITFTSYFSSLDMVEALNGLVTDKRSYLDYGYFGVLSAEFDENGLSTGEYTPKPSYTALGTLASVFSTPFEPKDLTIKRLELPSKRVNGTDCADPTVQIYGFKRENGAALVYWNSVPLLTSTYEGTISFDTFNLGDKIRIVDLATGDVYKLPDQMIEKNENGHVKLVNLPITDSVLLLTFGDFIPDMD